MSRRALCRWCIALAVFFAAYFALRTSRAAMNWLWYGAVLPAEQWLGRLCGRAKPGSPRGRNVTGK